MGRATSLGAFTRREAILASCLLVGAAIFALAGPLHAPWLHIVGLIVAVVGAVTGLVLVARRTRLEGQRERAEFDRRTRVPIAAVTQIDPTLIGVDAAAQDILPGEQLPDYVARDVDRELHTAIKGALDGTGRWIVVALGTSKVGKSRAMFQALMQCAPDIDLLAPVGGDALRSLLTPGETPRSPNRRCILWLDDLEPFLDQDVTFQTLREWHADEPGRIVVATLGGKGSDVVAGSVSGKLATTASGVLQNAREVGMHATTPSEIAPLQSKVTRQVLASIEQHGLAAYLVAASLLEQKLLTQIHAVGELRCPEGAAVVYAAIDWARCGRTDPITDDTLRKLWDSYLPPGADGTDEGFKTGLAWALKPVAGTIALLQRTGSYRAYDYIVQFVDEQTDAAPPHHAAWANALDDAADAQALAVGMSAYGYGRLSDAAAAVRSASHSSTNEVAAVASFNLGVVLGELGRSEEELEVYDDVVARFGQASEPALRKRVAKALVNKGVVLGGLGRSEEALGVYEEVVARFGQTSEPVLRDQVASALFNKGVRLGVLGRSEEEVGAYEEVEARFGRTSEPVLRERVARALFNKGVVLGELGRSEEALGVYEEVVVRFGQASEPTLREIAVQAAEAKNKLIGAEDS